MPIEFRCDSCQHLLRTGDDTAGKKARCPKCGNIQTVPGGFNVAPTVPPATATDPHSPFVATTQPALGSPQNPFAEDRATNPYAASHSPQTVVATPEAARSKLLGPAIALLVVCGLALMLWLLVAGVGISTVVADGADDEDMMALGMFAVSILTCLLTIVGAVQMIRLRSYGLALTVAIVAVIPCSCQWILTVPFGIWALIVLSNADVKSQFQ